MSRRFKPHDSTVIPVGTRRGLHEGLHDRLQRQCLHVGLRGYLRPLLLEQVVLRSHRFIEERRGYLQGLVPGKKNGYCLNSLTPSSSGTVLTSNTIMNFDEQGQSCGAYNAKTVLKYPDNWQMQTTGLKQDLWSLCWLKFSFTEGDHGKMIGG